MIPLTETALPMFIEFFADATGVGKSFAAWRTRYHFEQAGIRTTLVRIETRGVAQRLRAGDIFIPVEDFALAAQRPGGIVGVLAPLSETIARAARTRSVVIADWAGGLAQHHAAHLIATHFDERLAELGVTGLSFVVTTNRTEQMRQSAENLGMLATTAPGLHRCLLLNARFGGFAFPRGSRPAAVYRDLSRAAENNCATITLPAVVGDSWKYCEDANLRMAEVVRSTPAELAKATGLDPFTAAACVTEIAAFWDLSEQAFNQVWRFRARPAQ
jgi:hypothetical protein